AIERQLRQTTQYSLRTVINATGVVLHTNLGGATLSARALEHVYKIASEDSILEFDIVTGERGKRDVHIARLFAKLLGSAHDGHLATVVFNNNAAAVLLALNTLA